MLKIEGQKFDWVNIPFIQCVEGNALDTHFTIKVYDHLLDEVRNKTLEGLYEKLISPLTIAFRDIELEGLLIDRDKLNELKVDCKEKIEEVEATLKSSPRVPDDANLNSNPQLCQILFSIVKDNKTGDWIIDDSVGLGLYPFEWTKKGSPSTSSESLEKVKALVEKEYVRRGLNVSE